MNTSLVRWRDRPQQWGLYWWAERELLMRYWQPDQPPLFDSPHYQELMVPA